VQCQETLNYVLDEAVVGAWESTSQHLGETTNTVVFVYVPVGVQESATKY